MPAKKDKSSTTKPEIWREIVKLKLVTMHMKDMPSLNQ